MDILGRPANSIRILLSEGSSLSARQAISALGPQGYSIDICDPDALCLGRLSRYVRKWYRCPPSGNDPQGYLTFLLNLLQQERYDVLLPVQEQVFLFAKVQDQLLAHTRLAVPDFKTIEHLQSKIAFTRVLNELALPYPPTTIVYTQPELEKACSYLPFPYYIKTAYGTASTGVWRINTTLQLSQTMAHLKEQGYLADVSAVEDASTWSNSQGLLVQKAIDGTLGMVHAIFDHGRPLALHCWQRLEEGARGSSSAKQAIKHPHVQEHIMRLGEYLRWHGSLSIDYIFNPQTGDPFYIDANPRLVECMNATLSGLNLADIMVRLSLGEEMPLFKAKREGVSTRMLMMAVLGVSERGGNRLSIGEKMLAVLRQKDAYANTVEELTPFKIDFLSIIPLLVVMAQLLLNPKKGKRIASGAVENYSLSLDGIRLIEQKM